MLHQLLTGHRYGPICVSSHSHPFSLVAWTMGGHPGGKGIYGNGSGAGLSGRPVISGPHQRSLRLKPQHSLAMGTS
jgi:hypothetical protein